MTILAIETSCDETAIAIADFFGLKRTPQIRVRSHIVSSQVNIHRKYGGVVPNLARRGHERNLVPILLRALEEAGLHESRIKKHESRERKRKDALDSRFLILSSILSREPELLKQFQKHIAPLPPPTIDTIAVTHGPGLAPALWAGVNFARALALLWKKPLIPMNHMAGHLYSAFLHKESRIRNQESGGRKRTATLDSRFLILDSFRFPVLSLLVSGGHTELVLMKKHGTYKILGETLDDAAGEAFDKVARILELPYPGGPEIARVATGASTEIRSRLYRDRISVRLPRPMLHAKNYDFSFSGLKTAVLYLVRDLKNAGYSIPSIRPAIAREFQQAVVDVLVAKTIRAAKEHKVKAISLGGGVAANLRLREALAGAIQKENPDSRFLIPDSSLCGDNALMIALAAFFTGKKKAPTEVEAEPNASLSSAC